jgi:cytochrome c
MRLRLSSVVFAFVSGFSAAAYAQDGAALFVKNCQTCHSIEKGAPARQGPPLYGVIGRKAGSVEGFKYSEGLKAAGWEWTPEKIDQWISFPKKMIRDTFMVYRQNDPAIRKAIVDYLVTQKD